MGNELTASASAAGDVGTEYGLEKTKICFFSRNPDTGNPCVS